MTIEILKDDSKIQTKVLTKIKNYFSTLAKQNSWTQIVNWKKPSDIWYNQVEDGATIDINVVHVSAKKNYLVYFEGVPKVGKSKLRVDVGTLPFTT